jgi:hypothetical protein
MSEPTVQPWNILAPRTDPRYPPFPPPDEEPDEIWGEEDIGEGTAWVYRSPGHTKVVRPVIISDGFNSGKSDLNELWHGMERGSFPFITELRNQGSDLIILGYNERSASILENAEVATACILKAAGEPSREAELAVGGFSMGGLVTRYALAKMEHENQNDHHTALYYSYDSPHRGAWIPICLQALAHFLRLLAPKMSNQINSSAARQLLLWHIAEYDDKPAEDPLRREFLDELERVGGWPGRPHKLGLANGSGSGVGNGVPPGVAALTCTGQLHPFNTTTLYTQARDDNQLVAQLKSSLITNPPVAEQPIKVYTSEMLEFDGAPGGTLESFGIARDEIAQYSPLGTTKSDHRSICFVPSISAVAIRDPNDPDSLYADISSLSPEDSELDEFLCASDNQTHSLMTEELGRRLIDRLPK